MSAALNEAELEAIRSLGSRWDRACMDRDWDALLALSTDDIMFMPPGQPTVSGEDLKPWLDAFPSIKSIEWVIESADMAGDLAVIRGPLQQVLEKDGETIDFRGKYCDVLRKGEDGNWRFACVIWNET